jgi:hypothetical protein
MESKCWLSHRRAILAVAVAVVALSFAGCSSIGPDSSWTANEGTIEGTVVSNVGKELPDIQVRLWGGIDEECNPIEYLTTTDLSGMYEVSSVDLGGSHAYELTYQMYVNRTPSSAAPINEAYGTYVGTVTVCANGTWHDVTIVEAPPGPPDSYFE